MQFRILGTLEVVDDLGRVVEIAGRKPRALLALLLLNANETVSVSRLVDELWGDRPPANASKAIQVYVSRLRRALEATGEAVPERIRTAARGYAIAVEEGELDIARFTALAEVGDRALAAGDAERAAARLADALALWRGPPLEEFSEEPFAPELGRLGELRLAALEQRIDADLALGRHGALVAELADLVRQHPFRERLRGQLMLALARSGRQADALAVYQEGRTRMIYELGLEPGAPLRDIERAILQQSESASPQPAPAVTMRPGRAGAETPVVAREARVAVGRPRRLRLAVALVALVAVGLATALAVGTIPGAGPPGGSPAPHALAAIDPGTGRAAWAVPVGEDPGYVAVGEGAVWVASLGDRTLSRVDPDARSTRTFGLGFSPGGLAAGEGAVWVSDPEAGALLRLNATTGELERTIPLDAGGPGPVPVAVGRGLVWAANSNAFRLFGVDPAVNRVVARFELDAPRGLVVTPRAVWALEGAHALAELDLRTGRVARVPVEFTPGGIAVGDDAVWATDPDEDVVWRFDARTRSAERTISVGQAPTGVAFGHGAVWVANAFDGTVSKIDPSENRVLFTVPVGDRATAVAAGAGAVWVAATEP